MKKSLIITLILGAMVFAISCSDDKKDDKSSTDNDKIVVDEDTSTPDEDKIVDEDIVSDSDVKCIGDGKGLYVSGPEECCEGLKGLGAFRVEADGSCTALEGGSFCTSKCGDNTCGEGENKCNCPEDCTGDTDIDFPTDQDEIQPDSDMPEKCVGAGELYLGSGPESCCEGLKPLASYEIKEDGTCGNPLPGETICSSLCGNNVCDSKENKCNCAEDCDVPMIDTDLKGTLKIESSECKLVTITDENGAVVGEQVKVVLHADRLGDKASVTFRTNYENLKQPFTLEPEALATDSILFELNNEISEDLGFQVQNLAKGSFALDFTLWNELQSLPPQIEGYGKIRIAQDIELKGTTTYSLLTIKAGEIAFECSKNSYSENYSWEKTGETQYLKKNIGTDIYNDDVCYTSEEMDLWQACISTPQTYMEITPDNKVSYCYAGCMEASVVDGKCSLKCPK